VVQVAVAGAEGLAILEQLLDVFVDGHVAGELGEGVGVAMRSASR
jgi:hypothetical protein